jgi:hypothetical protein
MEYFMRRTSLIVFCALLLAAFALVSPSTKASAAVGSLSNLQFTIGCSGFTASADTTNGFGFFVDALDSSFSVGEIKSGTGNITISADYGVTLPEGTVVYYIYGDYDEPYDEGFVACSDGAGAAGRPIPSAFQLRTITCTTAVYDSAGGSPVSGAVVKASQTWYVSPTAVKDAAGKLWTEIYVSGSTNGFVPTSCVS